MTEKRMAAAMERLWSLTIPQTRRRLQVLQAAADDLARSRTIDAGERADAASTAHHLASALAMFGLRDAVRCARDVEATLDHAGLPQPERLQQQVQALQLALKSRIA